jgi:hypothetical protein
MNTNTSVNAALKRRIIDGHIAPGQPEEGGGMSAFSNSSRPIKGSIVLVNPYSGAVQEIIVLQSQQKADTRSFDGRPVKRSVR